jgi:uncharacterized membrane protein YhiD involved in acid resistance
VPELRNAWEQFQGTVSLDQNQSAIRLSVYLVIAGLMSLYLRALYRKCSASASDSESFSRVFPILAIITTAVIAVVKSSLALSLGLVGALSIVRFRAAIKDPEELIYLFLCIAIGLALGAELPLLAVALVSVSTVFILVMHYTSRRQRADRLLLTISGDSHSDLISGDQGVIQAVESIAGRSTLQRFDLENGRGQIRLVLPESSKDQTAQIVTRLRERFPECEFSYVNLNSTF